MRILHVSDCYLPRLGGIETQVHHLAARQHAAGDDVHVLTATPLARGDLTDREVVDGVLVIRAVANLPFELPVHPRTGREVARVLDAARAAGRPYDVAHVHTGVLSPFAYGALGVLLRAGVPVVITVHSMWGQAERGFALLDRVRHWASWPVVLSSVSEVAAAPLRRVAPGADVRVIHNGLDLAAWAAQPRQEHPDDVLIVAAMRLAPRKRALTMLRILRRVRRRVGPEVSMRVLVVGDGPLRPWLQRYVDAAAMGDWVDLPGRWPRERLREVYRRADVFLSTSDLESFGIAALEARVSGVPVLAKTSTGVGEFVTHDVDGLLVEDDAALADALTRLVADPALRARLAAGASSPPAGVGWDEVLASCRDAYAAPARLVAARS